jgi:NAD(P)-dependent dehydrogenase (short-subunit alcohol dehydrogenase family)
MMHPGRDAAVNGSLHDQKVLVIGRGSGIARAVALAARDAGARVTAAARNPARRIGTTDDVANTVLFAMSSTFLTGQTLHIDGGEPLT